MFSLLLKDLISDFYPIHLTAKYTKLSHAVTKIAYFPAHNLICNKIAMLKFPDDVSETSFNVQDKVCIFFGARENVTRR